MTHPEYSFQPYPEYKDSGVAWLGEIPAHWDIRRYKYLLKEINDRSVNGIEKLLSVSQYTGVTPRRLREGMNEAHTRAESLVGYKHVSVNDLVVNIMLAWNGSLGISNFKGIISPAYCVYRFREYVDPYYHHNLLRSPTYKGRIKAASTGVVESRLRLYSDDLFRIEALVPPLDEQQTIVRFITHIDHRVNSFIHAKRRLITLLNEQKQALIHQAVTRGLDPNVRLKPSGVEWLGEVPEQWNIVRLGTIAASLQTGPFGSQLHAHDYKPGGTPVINPSHMKDGRIVADYNCAVGPDKFAELSRHQLQINDIVFARRGELGRCALVQDKEVGWICGTGSLRVRLKDQVGIPEYLLQLFLSKGVAEWLSLQSVGATMDNLNTGILARLPLLLPPLREQQAIVDFLYEQNLLYKAAFQKVNREIDLIREYRIRLIADVVTGKLDVRGVVLSDDLPIDDLMLSADELAADDDDMALAEEPANADD